MPPPHEYYSDVGSDYGEDEDSDQINLALNMPRLTDLFTSLCRDLAYVDPEYGDLMHLDDFIGFVKSTTSCFKYTK